MREPHPTHPITRPQASSKNLTSRHLQLLLRKKEKKAEEDTGAKELRLVIKADVSGSAEALTEALQYIGNDEARVKIVTSDVGEVSEPDVLRAKAADGTFLL